MRETDADRSWQAGHGKPWTSIRNFFWRDVQGRSNAGYSWLVTALHSLSRGPGRTFLWKSDLRLGRWCFKSGDTKTEAQCSCLLPQIPKEISSINRRDWWLENSRAKKWISEQSPVRCRGTRSHYSVDTTRVKPKLHRRRRRNLRKLLEPSK